MPSFISQMSLSKTTNCALGIANMILNRFVKEGREHGCHKYGPGWKNATKFGKSLSNALFIEKSVAL